jgi:hypothetical protein
MALGRTVDAAETRAAGGGRVRARVRRLFMALGALAVAASAVAFLDQAGVVPTTIQAVSGAGGVPGAPYQIVPVASTVTIPVGRASLTAGVEMAYVNLAVPADSASVGVDVNWLDPQDAAAVLHNPNAVIVVGLYYPVASAADCPTAPDPFSGQAWYDVTTPTAATVCLAPGAGAWATLEAPSPRHQGHTTDKVIAGLPAGVSTFYVLASIVTPGHAPPGQQANLSGLDFRLAVRGG